MESRTVKELLGDVSTILGDIADLNEGERYPVKVNGIETTESAVERAKTLACCVLSGEVYELYEALGLMEDWIWFRVKKKPYHQIVLQDSDKGYLYGVL